MYYTGTCKEPNTQACTVRWYTIIDSRQVFKQETNAHNIPGSKQDTMAKIFIPALVALLLVVLVNAGPLVVSEKNSEDSTDVASPRHKRQAG